MLAASLARCPLAPDVDLRRLAAATPGLSGADLAELARRAAMSAIREMVAAEEEQEQEHGRGEQLEALQGEGLQGLQQDQGLQQPQQEGGVGGSGDAQLGDQGQGHCQGEVVQGSGQQQQQEEEHCSEEGAGPAARAGPGGAALTWRHLEEALGGLRPSVSPADVARYASLADQLRQGSLPAPGDQQLSARHQQRELVRGLVARAVGEQCSAREAALRQRVAALEGVLAAAGLALPPAAAEVAQGD